jgi:protein subunit release factor B
MTIIYLLCLRSYLRSVWVEVDSLHRSIMLELSGRFLLKPYYLVHLSRCRSISTNIPHRLTSEDDHREAARWIERFDQDGIERIPKTAYEITMTRSSGPGGQVSTNLRK